MQMWAEDVNKKGGLLGRPVELVYYDDQTKPAAVPGIYTKLLDVDKVNFIVSGYGTNVIAPLFPIAMERNLLLMGLFGMANNEKFNYKSYFQIMPSGPNPALGWSQGFFEVAAKQQPKPQTIALVGADAEYPHNALVGAREHAKNFGFKVVYDGKYPPSTVDYTPIIRAIKATNPDLVYVASYPPDTAGIIQAAQEVGLPVKMFGGGMVGLQFAALQTKLASKLTTEGSIRVVASDMRSQSRNRELAEERLAELVRRALIIPRKRRPTKPTKASREARLEEKKRRASKKRDRQQKSFD